MNPRAFTLVEVLIALALIAGLSLAVMSFARDIRVQQRSMIRLSSQLEQTTDVIEMLERSIATCTADGGDAGAGIQGTAQSLRVLSRAVQLRPQDRLSDLLATGLRFDAGGKRIVARQWAPVYESEGESESVATSIEFVQFRYYHDGQWRESFDAFAAGGLPRAIEFAIWYQPLITPSPAATLPEELDEEELTAPRRAPDRLRIIAIHDSAPSASSGVAP